MHLLRRSPALARLAIAETISPLGDAMATVAIILHLQSRGGSGTSVALVLFAEAIPPVLAPFAGTIADRVADRRRLVVTALVLQAVVVSLLAVALPRAGLVFIAAMLLARASLDTFASPALGAIVPSVIDPADLPSANGTMASARELGAIIGPPLAGIVFAAAGASWALAADALTFLLAVPFVATLPASRAHHDLDQGDAARVRADIVEGMRLVWHSPVIRAVAIGFWVTVFFSAPDDLVLPFLARDEFGASPVAIGVTMAAASVGLVLATPFVRAVAARVGPVVSVIVVGGLVMATGNLLTAFAPVLAAAFAGQVVRGAGIVLYDAAGVRTLLQRDVPPRLMGRALANVYGGVGVAAAVGYLPGGWILDATSPRAAFAVIGLGGIAGVGLTFALIRRARS